MEANNRTSVIVAIFLGDRILWRKCKSVYALVLVNQQRSCLNVIYAVSPHKKHRDIIFQLLLLFLLLPRCRANKKSHFLCIFSLQCINTSFSWKITMLYFHFFLLWGKWLSYRFACPALPPYAYSTKNKKISEKRQP